MKKIIMTSLVAVFTLFLLIPAFSAGQEETAGVPEVAVVVKATDSDFWQYVIIGAENYAKENPDKVKVTTYGPPSEADVEKQLGILENVISRGVDGIVIASNAKEGAVPILQSAGQKGIPVVAVDTKIPWDDLSSFLATDNVLGGKLAAEQMVEFMKSNGIALKGTVGIIAAVAGVSTIVERDGGFIERMTELAPDIKILEPRYVNNDIIQALGVAEDLITTYDDLIGIYADNNHTGDGVARAVGERNLQDKVIVTAFDSDPEQIDALREGVIKALIVQTPYNMGYMGVDYVLKVLAGESIPAFVDTGVNVITQDNMNTPEMKGVLDPTLLKK